MKMTGIVFYAQPPTSCPEPAGQSRKDEVACPALNINPPHSSKSFLGDIVSVDEKDFGLPECPDRHAYPQFIVIDEHVAMRPDIVLFPVVFQKIKIIENIQLFSVFEEDQIMVFGIIDRCFDVAEVFALPITRLEVTPDK